MLPIERRECIRELILEHSNLKISELSKELGVSEMTIHRDLKPLIDNGMVIKTFGGISLAQESSAKTDLSKNVCVFCHRRIEERLAYQLILDDNSIEMACCAHCGLLRHRQLYEKVPHAMCHDFFIQTTVSAPTAWYVMDTSVHIGCCQPQVLTFAWREQADQFVYGFGGKVYSFQQAMEVVFQKMNGCQTEHCSQSEHNERGAVE